MLSAVIPSKRSQPAVLLAEQLAHQRFVRPGPLVLGTAPLKSLTLAADRDRTVSRRSKPSSRTALMGEQPNPWDLLQPQDATSRHRGAKPCRRCDALQFLAVQTIPLSLSRQWRVMEGVNLPLAAVPTISRRCEKSLQGKLVLHAWNDVRGHEIDEPPDTFRADAQTVAIPVSIEPRCYSKFSM